MGAGRSQTQDLTDDNAGTIMEVEGGLQEEDGLRAVRGQVETLLAGPSSDKCPGCSSLLKPVLSTAGRTLALLQCPQCPDAQTLCKQCLYPCPYITGKSVTACTNKSCHLVATLLSCDLVTDPNSQVKGCPLFRACPKCHSLMMHGVGCKYVTCAQCKHKYCFICLQKSEKCIMGLYGSLTYLCPRAARQRFRT